MWAHLFFLFCFISVAVTRKSKEQIFNDFMLTPPPTDNYDWNKEEPPLKVGIKRFGQADPSNETSRVKVSSWNHQIVAWAIVDPEKIFAIALNGTALISRDGLLTFSPFPAVSGKNREVWHNPLNKNFIIFLGIGSNWVSTDGGSSFTQFHTNVDVRKYKFHPTNPNLGIAEGSGKLYLTTDMGRTFQMLLPEIVQFEWCQSNGRICTIASTDRALPFRYSDDLGKTWVDPLKGDAFFFRMHDRFFTLLGSFENTYSYFVSSDSGTSFHRVLLPRDVNPGLISPQQFLEDSNGVIWIVVNPSPTVKDKSQSGNLYTSDAEGYEFSLVLKDVHTYNGFWDVEMIKFMEGTLFANKFIGEDVDGKPKLITTITYDNGDTWLPLERPDTDVNGKNYSCATLGAKQCALHLFGITTWLGVGGDGFYGDLKTEEDAVGLIVGTGNVGDYLSTNSKNINTYLSLDGGASWDEVMEGSTIYDFGDFGGLLVLARNRVPTKKIYYTWNGGKNFSFVELPTQVSVVNIMTVSTKSETFIVFSYEQVGASKIPRIWGIDFNQLHTRNCSASDYEEWTPNNGAHGPKCVLGRDLVYRRRKRDSACYTDNAINQIVSNTPCPCDEDRDYECDMNWGRAQNSGKCAYEGQPEDYVTIGCSNGESTYKVSKGYRKVPGNTCVGDIEEFKPTIKDCPKAESTSSTPWGLIIFGGVTLVLVALITGFCFGVRDERVRKMFPWLNQAPSWVTAGYSNSLVVAEMGDEFDDDEVRLSGEDTSLSEDTQ